VHMLSKLSAYQTVVLTDLTSLPDGTSVQHAFQSLRARVHPLAKVSRGENSKNSSLEHRRVKHLQDVQAWSLVEFEKVVVLQPDASVYRDIDWLFEREGVWAARHDPLCTMDSKWPSAEIMLVQPSDEIHRGLSARITAEHLAKNTFREIVAEYYKDRDQEIGLLSEVEADHGQCMGNRIPTPYRNMDGTPVTGSWSTPAIVQRSGGVQYTWLASGDEHTNDNVCFSMDLKQQRILARGHVINVCHYHPLGSYWRDHFCRAAQRAVQLVKLLKVAAYCSDDCYYRDANCDIKASP